MERHEVVDADFIEKLRKDFLLLMKQVAKVGTYADAEKVAKACTTWYEYVRTIVEGGLMDASVDALYDKHGRVRGQAIPPEMTAAVVADKPQAERLLHLALSSLLHVAAFRVETLDSFWSEERALLNFQQNSPRWERRAREGAREAWKHFKEYLDFVTGDTKVVQAAVPDDEHIEIEGFQIVLRGIDYSYVRDGRAEVQKLQRALRAYKARAKRVLPWLLRYAVPIVYDFKLDLQFGGFYHEEFILVKGAMADDTTVVNVIAHEMGHHLWRARLSEEDHAYWKSAVTGDYLTTLDLPHLLKLWRKLGGGSDDLERYLRAKAPVLLLQWQAIEQGHLLGNNEGIAGPDELEAFIAKGTASAKVPRHPITPYATKNSEEAFCEAVGKLVTYGPRAVLPLVRTWLSTIIPDLQIE